MLDVEFLSGKRKFEHVRRTQNSDNMFQAVATDDDACVGRLRQAGADLIRRQVEVKHIDIVAVRHDRADTLLVKT